MQQYIDFFTSCRAEIEAQCHPLLNVRRQQALDQFLRTGFPPFGSEDYQHTDIRNLLKENFGFYLQPPTAMQHTCNMFQCLVATLNSYRYFMLNGWFYDENAAADIPQGVFAGSLNVFAACYPQIFERYFNRQAADKGDGLSAFNTMFAQDGYVLYVPADTIVEKPFQLTNLSGGNVSALTNRRLLVVLEAGAQAKLLVCDHSTNEQQASAATQVTEIYLGEHASFDFYEMEESNRKNVRLATTFVEQAASSHAIFNNITLSNGVTRNNFRIDLSGDHAESLLYGMAIADKEQQIDNQTLVNHLAKAGRCDELYKYVLDDEAVGVFSGRIVVAQAAQQTQAFQTNRNLLGNRQCRMFSKPQLEIYADDVKCSHGMTTGQLDENALFYMRARGIPETEAVMLLKFAFMNDVIQGVRIDGLRDRLKLLIEKRFRGELASCRCV